MLNFGNKEFRNLQEQVLKNAQDIETLKGRENLQIVIVEELPEEGNPNYIYLVPNDEGEQPDVYEEYIWLADEERYELIGGVSIDLTNYVTLDTAQTITGSKTFSGTTYVTYGGKINFATSNENVNWDITTDAYENVVIARNAAPLYYFGSSEFSPKSNNARSLGTEGLRWKNLYLSGKIDFGTKVANRTNTVYMDLDNYDGLRFYVNNNNVLTVYDNAVYIKCNFIPNTTNSFDLGSNTRYFTNLYLVGNISDGINTVSVANIASKVTSSYASGTFDSNGEDTIDISGGTPEGLFIFACGNCQAMLHLTATMIQNAELTPIVVSCYYIETGTPQQGQLKISKSGTTLTLFLGASVLSHVDSGYAWTLTKTNLL